MELEKHITDEKTGISLYPVRRLLTSPTFHFPKKTSMTWSVSGGQSFGICKSAARCCLRT